MPDEILQEWGFTDGGENDVLAKRPYITANGETRIAYNTGKFDANGAPIYGEQRLQTNGTLRKDEWKRIDDAILESARQRFVIVDDLRAAGMVQPLGGLGVLISEWETSSEMGDAEVSMDGETKNTKDRPVFGMDGVPVPLIHKDFKFGERAMLASRTRGSALDVTGGTEAAISVARRLETLVFSGAAALGTSSGYTLQGLYNRTGRTTTSLSDWTLTATTTETIFKEIMGMVKTANTTLRRYGPFNLYIPGDVKHRFSEDFKANSDKTLRQRILEEDEIAAIRVSDGNPTKQVALLEMTRGAMDLAIASDVATIQWSSGSGFTHNFKTFAAMAPRIKKDFGGRFGYIHGIMS